MYYPFTDILFGKWQWFCCPDCRPTRMSEMVTVKCGKSVFGVVDMVYELTPANARKVQFSDKTEQLNTLVNIMHVYGPSLVH